MAKPPDDKNGSLGFEDKLWAAADVLRKVGESGFLQMFMGAATWGTPDMILAKLEQRRELLGSFAHTVAFRDGGIPDEEATASMRLFASEVMPVLQSWN